MTLIRGNKLNDKAKAQVLAQFVHRWTHENPHRTTIYKCELCDVRNPYHNEERANGHTHPTIALVSDEQWLLEHAFWVKRDGSLSESHKNCEPAYIAP